MDEKTSRSPRRSPIGREEIPILEEFEPLQTKWRFSSPSPTEFNSTQLDINDPPLVRRVFQASWSCQHRMQNAIDVLLSSGEIRSVQPSTSTCTLNRSFTRCRDKVLGHAREVTSSLRSLVTILASGLARSSKACICLEELRDFVVILSESCAHAAYVRAIQNSDCRPPSSSSANGFDRYSACYATSSIERKLATFRRHAPEELTATARADVCQHVEDCVESLEKLCELPDGSGSSGLPADLREPLKLCSRSIRASCDALRSVVGGLAKDKMSPEALACCQTLADAVVASCHSLVALTGICKSLNGNPERLGTDSKFHAWVLKSSAVGVISPCILVCDLVRLLAQNPDDGNAQAKAKGCLCAVNRGTVKLAKALGVTIIDISN